MVIDLEADRMENLLLVPESFEKEREVVLNERKMRYENSDRGKLYLQMMRAVFKGTPYGSSVIGEVKDLKTVSREEVHAYFKRFYAPNNAIIVVVGDVKAEKVFTMIEEKYGEISTNEELEDYKEKHLSKLGYKFRSDFKQRIHLKGTTPTPMFSLAFKGIKIGQRDAFILDILSSILGDGESSYLSRKFVMGKRPLLQNIYAANYTLQDSGVFFIGGQLLDRKRVNQFEAKLKKEIVTSCDHAINERSMKKVINQYMGQMLNGLDTNAGVARFLGDREVYYGSYDFYKKELGIYESITKRELQDVCKKYLNPKSSLILTIWNKN